MEYTKTDVEKYIEENREDLVQSLRNCETVPAFIKTPAFQIVWDAGCWLNKVLKKHDASEKENRDICFAHGQRCFGRNPIDEAVRLMNEFLVTGTTKDRPGPKLAEEIAKDVLKK